MGYRVSELAGYRTLWFQVIGFSVSRGIGLSGFRVIWLSGCRVLTFRFPDPGFSGYQLAFNIVTQL